MFANTNANVDYYDVLGVSEDASLGDREEDAVLPLTVSLERMYPGGSQKVPFLRKCKGTGGTIDDEDCGQQSKCETVVMEKNLFEAHVEEGMQNMERITFPGEFNELSFEVLSDPVQCEIDDYYGEDALMEDMYSGGPEPNYILASTVSLEVLYNGASEKVPFCRYVTCSNCKGTGETIDDKDCCQQCKGEKVVVEKKVLDVLVEKGMQNGQMITLPGEDEGLVFLIVEQQHPKFQRNGDDLFVEHTLSLTEALCGFQFELTHLDNRQLIIKSEPGEVVQSGHIKEISDEGMPVYQKPFMRGKLYIQFTVELPGSLTPDQSKTIESVLPPRSSPQLTNMEQ